MAFNAYSAMQVSNMNTMRNLQAAAVHQAANETMTNATAGVDLVVRGSPGIITSDEYVLLALYISFAFIAICFMVYFMFRGERNP